MDIYFIDLNLEQNMMNEKISLNKIHHKFSRLFLKNILKNIYGIESEILEKNKKPYIINNPIYFNISHSKSVIGIAFDKNNIGFDIEYKKERNIKGLLHHYGLENENITEDEFYQMWTVYEAEYKSANPDKIISFNYKDYMCSVSCSDKTINKIVEIQILNPKIINEDVFIAENNYTVNNLKPDDFTMLEPLKIKLN